MFSSPFYIDVTNDSTFVLAIQSLKHLDKSNQIQTIELKRNFLRDLNKEIIAFANTHGGEILIGIDNNGLVAGLSDIEAVELQCVNHISNTIL